MNYEQYHQKGGTYVIPVEVFNDLLNEKEELQQEKQEIINYLKEKINICDDIIKYHTKAINEVVNISDNNRHIILIRRFTIEKQVYEEILSKIEKSDN